MSNVRRLPGPIADLWDWQRLGLCRGRDSAQFFHPDGERGSSRNRREAKAKTMCGACPVRAECAAHALAVREPYGVWGGFSEAERLRLLAVGWEDLADRTHGRVDLWGRPARGITTQLTTRFPAGSRAGVFSGVFAASVDMQATV
jgi:WhiB family redox-sensing transcriptional regulator